MLNIADIKRKYINSNVNSDAFFVVNIEDIIEKYNKWQKLLPRVRPYYAVKCNNMPVVLQLLSGLGLAFDCSSRAEIEAVLKCNVIPEDIIFANCCKSLDFVNYSKSVGVKKMTFDNEDELKKIAMIYPSASLILRIKADDQYSSSKLGLKFGAEIDNCNHLLKTAKDLNLNVCGVAFHVGSGCQSTDPYVDAIEKAKYVFKIGQEMGFSMTVLDIGGGFPGSDSSSRISFEEIANIIDICLFKHFSLFEYPNLTILAEPGRYFVMSAFTLITNITSRRIDLLPNGQKYAMYYLNDGLYGSFSSVITGNKVIKPIPLLMDETDPRESFPCVLWGPSCDSWDCIKRDILLPEMKIGEWLMFHDMGSYSIAAASDFNGMPHPKIRYFISEKAKDVLKTLKNWQKIQNSINI